MNISVLKNTANVFKAFAVRFFDLYFIIYALLITAIAVSGKNYISTLIICGILLTTNCIYKFILNINNFYRNIGFKYGICVVVLVLTYIALSVITKNDLFNCVIILLSVLSLFGFYDTNINMISAIKSIVKSDTTQGVAYVIKEKDIGTSLFKLTTVYNHTDVDKVNDDVFNMLYEFLMVNNENQMGRLVVRSMTSCDENGTERICIKAKDKYQLIMRGQFSNIIDMCSEVVGEGELLRLDENLKNKICQSIEDNKLFARHICCAFKEVDDITDVSDDGYIFAGTGFYGYDNKNVTFDTVTDVNNKDRIINAFGENITIISDTLENAVNNLHDNNIFVCGKYNECDGVSPPSKRHIKICIADNFEKSINYIFLMLIAVILFASNFLLSVFSVDALSYNEIFASGVIIYIYSSAVVCWAKFKLSSNNKFYINCVINVLAVLCSYFIGRYVMVNGEFMNDLFYKITASAMATVTLIMCILFSHISTVEFNNTTSKICDISLYTLFFIFFMTPLSKIIFQGYNISNIYICTSFLISLCAYAVLEFINFILFYRRKNNER